MSQMVYKFKQGARLAGSPQVIGEELERVRMKSGGLTAKSVVRAAEPAESPLHPNFTWDDTEAARKHREEEARHLVRHVVAEVAEGGVTKTIRAFAAVGNNDDRYVPIKVVLADPEMRAELLRKAREELEWFSQKYSGIQELTGVLQEIETFRSQVPPLEQHSAGVHA